MKEATSEALANAYQLAIEARCRMSMTVTAYRRGNLRRLRRAHQDIQKVIRLAVDLAAAGFRLADALDEELRHKRRETET